MAHTWKFTTLLLIIVLAASSLISINSACGATNVSVPEFSVKFVAYPYDIPTKTITTIDPYTGKETTHTEQGYHVDNRSIEIKIKNQPFTSQHLSGFGSMSEDTDFYLNIQTKGHYSKDWSNPLTIWGNSLDSTYPFKQSLGEFTVIPCSSNYPENAEIDFRMQATIGYWKIVFSGENTMPTGKAFTVLSQSDWTPIQTLTIGEPEIHTTNSGTTNTASPQTTPSPLTPQSTPTPTETAPTQTGNVQQVTQDTVLFGLEWKDLALVLLAVLAVVLILALVYSRKAPVK